MWIDCDVDIVTENNKARGMTPDDARQREHEHKERSGSASAEQGNGDCLLKMGDRIELHIF